MNENAGKKTDDNPWKWTEPLTPQKRKELILWAEIEIKEYQKFIYNLMKKV